MTKKVLLLLCALGITFGSVSFADAKCNCGDPTCKKEKCKKCKHHKKCKVKKQKREKCQNACCPTCKKTVKVGKAHTCREKDIKKANKKAAHKKAHKLPCPDCNKKTCKCKCAACHHPKKRCECPVCPTCNMNKNNCGCVTEITK